MGPAANAVAKVRFTSSNAHMYFLNMCSVLVFSPFSECVCSAGPVWEDNSRVHRQLLLDGGRGECEGDVAVLRELQWRRGGQQSSQRGQSTHRYKNLRTDVFTKTWVLCFLLHLHLLIGGDRGIDTGAHHHGLPGKPRQKHPAVQPEPDGSPGFQLQPGSAGHRPAAGSTAALPGTDSPRVIFFIFLKNISMPVLDSLSIYQFRIDRLNPSWTSSLSLGVIGHSPDRLNFPSTACCLKRSAWLLQRDSVFHNSLKVSESNQTPHLWCHTGLSDSMLCFPAQICENYGPNLDTCPEETVLGLLVDANSCLHLYVNGMDQGVAAQDIPSPCYPFIDLYGQCEQVCTPIVFNDSKKWDLALKKYTNLVEEHVLTMFCHRCRSP